MLDRQIARVLILAALFAVAILLVARPQDAKPATGMQSVPTASSVSALLVHGGARDARCIELRRRVFVCVYDYHGYCGEAEIVWTGKRFDARPVAARRGRCAWSRARAGKGPPA